MKFTEMNTLNYEQLSWFTNISEDEGKKIIDLMGTGNWHLIWRGKQHMFVLERYEPQEEGRQ